MKCLHPRSIRAHETAKFHPRTQFMLVPCGKCVNCFKHYVSAWTTRLEIHARAFNYSYFVTLTYNEENNPISVSKKDVQKYFKRIRKHYNFAPLSYVLISEYTPSGTNRPHYHFLCWSNYPIDFEFFWQRGFVTVDSVCPERIAYVLSYHLLKDDNIPDGCLPNFRLMSKHLGLDGFIDTELINAQRNDWIYLLNDSLQISPLHRYFRQKFDIHLDYTPSFDYPLKTKQQVKDLNSAIDIELDLYKLKKFRKKFNIL